MIGHAHGRAVTELRKMVILVTGGAGYIGSHCALALMDAGYDIVIYDNLETGHMKTVEALGKAGCKGRLVSFIKGDLRDREWTRMSLGSQQIDAVVHFAAFSQVAESMKDPGKYYLNNVCGTINLLDAMREYGIDKIVFSSTAATYGEPEYVPIDEAHPQDPINPYGSSKLMVERIMDDYSMAYGIRSVRLRYFNVAGADIDCRVGEWHEPETHLIPNILKSTFDGASGFKMFGTDYPTRDGTCVRDYINVEDLADAHVRALRYLEDGGETDFFNLGTSEGSTVKEVFAECERVTGMDIPVEVCGRRPGDPASLIADNTKARKILGWEPSRSLEDSVTTAYAWEVSRQDM